MTTLTQANRPIKQGLLGFFVTFTVILIVLTGQFLFHYKDDILGKGIDNIEVIKISVLSLLSFVTISLPISILIMTAVYFRQQFIMGETVIDYKRTLLVSTGIAFACFVWTAFLAPVNNQHKMGLLYDIQRAAPNEKMERTDLIVFEDSPSSQNYRKLGESIDAEPGQRIKRFQTEKMKMIGFPLMSFILFYTGMFLGIINRKNKLLFLLIGIYLTVIPSIYYLNLYFEKLVRETSLSPLLGQMYYQAILTLLTIGLFIIVKRQRH